MTFVLVHGGWCGGWWMSRLARALRTRGAEVFTPTLTGLGERAHLATPEIGLLTHVKDVLAVLHYEDLRDVVLVGHSYGGAVVTGVADKARDRIARLIYFDAFVLRDRQSLADVCPPGMAQALTELAQNNGGWQTPAAFTMEQFGVTDPDDVEWNARGIVPQPVKTFVEPLRLQSDPLPFPISYIYCTDRPMGLFDGFAARARTEGWDYHELHGTHAAPAVLPNESAELLMSIVGDRAAGTAV